MDQASHTVLWIRYLVDIMLKCRFCISNKLPDCAGPDGPWVPFEEPGFRQLALGPFLHDGGAKLYLGEGLTAWEKGNFRDKLA